VLRPSGGQTGRPSGGGRPARLADLLSIHSAAPVGIQSRVGRQSGGTFDQQGRARGRRPGYFLWVRGGQPGGLLECRLRCRLITETGPLGASRVSSSAFVSHFGGRFAGTSGRDRIRRPGLSTCWGGWLGGCSAKSGQSEAGADVLLLGMAVSHCGSKGTGVFRAAACAGRSHAES